MKQLIIAASAAAFVVSGSVAFAQSLGAVAQQEDARRKAVKTPSKVYTNDNLHKEAGTTTPASGAAAPAAVPAPAPSSGAQPDQPKEANKTPAADGQKKDEAYWKRRMADARAALDRAQTFAEALQSRINALSTDFVNRADPIQRSQIGADRDKALVELERVKKEVQDNTKEIANIQDEARRAGVPAAWVR